jgi:hypothetical protein
MIHLSLSLVENRKESSRVSQANMDLSTTGRDFSRREQFSMRSQREIEKQLQRKERFFQLIADEALVEERRGAYTSSRFEEATDTSLRLEGAIAALNWVLERSDEFLFSSKDEKGICQPHE